MFICGSLLSGHVRLDQLVPSPLGPEDHLDRLANCAGTAAEQRHVIGCHTYNHVRLKATLSEAEFDLEIRGAKQRLEEMLDQEIPAFAWVGGEEWSYSRQAAQWINRSGYKVSFMTNGGLIRPGANLFQLQRTEVETSWPVSRMRLSLSGIVDVCYFAKRRRVNRLTNDRYCPRSVVDDACEKERCDCSADIPSNPSGK